MVEQAETQLRVVVPIEEEEELINGDFRRVQKVTEHKMCV
jgi:hypothetical protein